jgi:hypothetical protein
MLSSEEEREREDRQGGKEHQGGNGSERGERKKLLRGLMRSGQVSERTGVREARLNCEWTERGKIARLFFGGERERERETNK